MNLRHSMTQPPKKTRKISPDTLTFIHTADLHLGSPLTGIRAMDENMAEKLTQASYRALDRIVDLAIRDEVDFVLIAGDLYDSKRQQIYEQLKLLHALERLDSHGILVYIACGNHDPHSAWSRSLKWPKNVHIMAEDGPEVVFFEKDGERKAAIVGVSYPRSSVWENLAATFPEKEDDWPFTIGLLHGTLGSSTGEHVSYAPCSEEDLAARGYDYWALGHIHKPAVVHQTYPTIVYPGIPQGRDIGESGPRGCYYVVVRPDGTIEPTFVETAEICWEDTILSIEGIETLDELDSAILEALDEIREERGGRQVCCRLTLTGRGEVHRPLREKKAAEGLADHLREVEPEVYIDRITDNTALPIDRETLVQREDLVGDILRISDGLQQNPHAAETLKPLFQDLFTDKRGKKCDPVSPEEIPDLFREAETYLLDLLNPEEEKA
ncbi:metallophosphoesterase family protein [Methanofollis fontis]|uniref:Phosphoesterase n=1 Tax=Methanofollis fontis TaxID=2052832 RepID=A0A483CS48_9EURY|nr:DNA repair exonuclease [Methanofollis fontis]TAJ43980.1 phosphoesterase [Methanofollis fontis]